MIMNIIFHNPLKNHRHLTDYSKGESFVKTKLSLDVSVVSTKT